MSTPPPFDETAAHEYFAVECFNLAWELIEKQPRTPEEDVQMLALAHASLWHWTRRSDCTPRNLSISYWQLSRVYVLLGQGELATYCAEMCLNYSQSDEPFFLGYAHESLARAAKVRGDLKIANHHLAEARRLAAQVTDAEDRAQLERDIETIR